MGRRFRQRGIPLPGLISSAPPGPDRRRGRRSRRPTTRCAFGWRAGADPAGNTAVVLASQLPPGRGDTGRGAGHLGPARRGGQHPHRLPAGDGAAPGRARRRQRARPPPVAGRSWNGRRRLPRSELLPRDRRTSCAPPAPRGCGRSADQTVWHPTPARSLAGGRRPPMLTAAAPGLGVSVGPFLSTGGRPGPDGTPPPNGDDRRPRRSRRPATARRDCRDPRRSADERWSAERSPLRDLDVVVSGHRDVPRYAQTPLGQRQKKADGDDVGGTGHRCRSDSATGGVQDPQPGPVALCRRSSGPD